MSDYLTPQAREHFERASAKGCVCGLCELIVALPEIVRTVKAQALQEAADRLEALDKPWESPLYESTILWLRASAQQLKEEA